MSLAWRAEAFGEPRDVLTLGEQETPEPGELEALISVAANGLNFLDVSICRGDHPVRPALPFVPGAEVVGTVSAVGSDVTELRVGERVAALNPDAHGCFREQAIVPAYAAYPIPTDIPDPDAAALLVTYQTAHIALRRRAALREGEWVLVHGGAGALGTALIQVARAFGGRVIATAGSEQKVQVCLDQGAEAALLYGDDFEGKVAELTDGRGADIVADQVGADLLLRSLDCAAFEGRLLPLGWASGKMAQFEAGDLVARNLTVDGVSWGSMYPAANEQAVREAHGDILRLYRAGKVRPVLGHVFRHTELPDALQCIADGASSGKSVMLWR